MLRDAGSARGVLRGGGATAGDTGAPSPAEADAVHASVETLFREHWEELRRVASGIVGSSDTAQDVVMNVVTAVLERAPDDRSILTSSYLFAAVRQEARKVAGRRSSRRELLTAWSDLGNAVGHGARDPEQVREMHQMVRVLRAALDRVPDGQRRACEARYVHGLTLGAAAARLGKTESNVRKQARRGLRRLEEVLRSLGIQSIDDIDGWDSGTDSA